MATAFRRVFFSLPNYHEVVEAFPMYDKQLVEDGYSDWLKTYFMRAHLFYMMQLRTHHELLWQAF